MVEDLGEDMDLARLAESVPEVGDLLEQEDDAPIIRLINALLAEAIREDASDVHIETFERDLSVRFRVDGVMREVVRPKRALAAAAGFSDQGHGETRHRREARAPRTAESHCVSAAAKWMSGSPRYLPRTASGSSCASWTSRLDG